MAYNYALSCVDAQRAADMIAEGATNIEVCDRLHICESTLIRSLKRTGLYISRDKRTRSANRILSMEQAKFAAKKLNEGMSYGELAEILFVHKDTLRNSLKAYGVFEYRKKAAT